jgi:hypothetical protein
MTDEETIVLLAFAALLDPRLKRVDDEEATERALAWHLLLADVDVNAARHAVTAHYATSREAIMPADILERVGVVEDPWAHLPDDSIAVYEASKKAALDAAGVSAEQWEANKHDAAWVHATFPQAVEATPSTAAIEERRGWL